MEYQVRTEGWHSCCPVHKKPYILIGDYDQDEHFLYCVECENELNDNNIALEQKFIEFIRKEYFILVMFPFFYSSLSLLIEIGELSGIKITNAVAYKVILTLVISLSLACYLIKTRRKTLRAVIPLSTIKPLDIKKSQVE